MILFRKHFVPILIAAACIMIPVCASGLHADALKVGDEAPVFNLQTWERDAEVSLASFKGTRPVVLIFGSYT